MGAHYASINASHGTTGAFEEELPIDAFCEEGVDVGTFVKKCNDQTRTANWYSPDDELVWELPSSEVTQDPTSDVGDFERDDMSENELDPVAENLCGKRRLVKAGCEPKPNSETCSGQVYTRTMSIVMLLSVEGYDATTSKRVDENFHFHFRNVLGVKLDWFDPPASVHPCGKSQKLSNWN